MDYGDLRVTYVLIGDGACVILGVEVPIREKRISIRSACEFIGGVYPRAIEILTRRSVP